MADDQVLNTSFTAEIGDVLTKLSNMIKGVLELASTSTVLASAMGQADASLKSVTDSLKKTEAAAEQLDRTLAQVGLGAKGAGSSLKETTASIAGVAAETEKGTKRSQEYKDALASLKSTYGDNAVAMKGLKAELGKVDDAFQQAIVKGDANSQSMQKIYQHTELVARAVNNYAGKANLSVIPLQKLAEGNAALGSKMSDTEFKATALGKAFMATSTRSKEFFDALVLGGERFGVNTDKTNSYVKSLIDVDKHLQSIPASSVNAKAAQSELADSMTLSQRAIEMMGGSIVKVKDGFEAIGSNVKASGTVMGQYGQTLVNLNKEHANLATGFKQYTEAHKTNSAAVSQAQDRLSKYIGIVDQVKAKYKDTNAALVQAGDGFRIYGDKVNDSAKVAKQMQYDTGLLTQTFYDQAQVQKVLRGEQELSVQALEKVAVTSNANRKGIQELAKDYTGLTKGLQDVGQYGQVYVDSLKATTAANFTEKAAVEQAIASHLKYAKTAEGLISQSQVMTDVTIKKIKASKDYANDLDGQNAAINTAKASHESLANALRSTQSIEAGLAREGGTLRDSMLNVANSMGVNVTQTDALRSAASQLLPMQEKYRTVIQGLNEQIKSGGLANETAKRQLDAHIQSVKAGEAAVQRATKTNEEHNKSLKETPTLLGKIGSTIGNYAIFTVASAAISAFVGTITGAISTVMEFDQTLHSLKAITGATNIEMSGMGDTIKEVSASSRYGVEEIGMGLQIMGQAGLSAADSMKTIGAATNLATGTLEKMENVVDLLTSTMSAYGISAGESTRITDILATAVNRSKLTIDKLRTSLNYVGVIAAQSGLSLEQTTASLMVLADRGMKASTIGTGLRQVLDKLIAPNEKLREAYQSHGIELSKISPLSVGYEEALRNLTKTLYDSGTGMVDTSKAFELFGIRGAQAATILIQSFASGEWKDTVNSFDEVGAASKMAAEQMLGLSALWENFVAKVKVLAVSLGEGGLSSVVRGLVQVLSFFADKMIEFTKIDFGFFGYIVSSVAALTAVLGAAYGAMVLYTAIMAKSAAIGAAFTAIINGITTAFSRLAVAMASNPFGLAAVLITGAVVAVKVFLSYLDSVVEAQNKIASSATEMSGSIDLFQQVIDKAADSPEKLKVAISRLKSEHPELAEEIKRVTNVLDIASLSYQELSDAMGMIKEQKLEQAIEANIQALNTLALRSEASAFWLGVLDSVWQGLSAMAETFNKNILIVTDTIAALMSMIPGFGSVAASASKAVEGQTKALAGAYVNAGKDIKKSIEEQKRVTLEKLDADLAAGKITISIYEKVGKEIDEEYKRMERRQKDSQVKYEKYTNEVGQFYANLSIKQREEVQNMVYEEEKAVEKFEKFAADKNLTAEEKDAELYAIHLKYRLKILDSLNEFAKKEYETEGEKFARQQALLDEKFSAVESEIAKEQASYDKFKEWQMSGMGKFLGITKTHLKNLETLHTTHEELVRKQQNLTFEQAKKLMSDTMNEVKANQSLQMALIESFELEKLRLQAATSEAELKGKQAIVDGMKDVLAARMRNGELTKAQIEAEQDAIRQAANEEIQIRAKTLSDLYKLGQFWVEQNNRLQDEQLAHIKDLADQERSTLQFKYDTQNTLAKSALDVRLALVDKEEQNTVKAEEKKNKIRLKYWAEETKLLDKNIADKIAIEEKEYQASIKAINDKYLFQQEYTQDVKNLYKTETDAYLENTSSQVKGLVQAQGQKNVLIEAEIDLAKAAYKRETDTLMAELTIRGVAVSSDIASRGAAIVKETDLNRNELRKRGGDWVKFGQDVYHIIKDQTGNVAKEAASQTSEVKKSFGDQIISLKTLTNQTVAELQAQGADWERHGDKIYKITTGKYNDIKLQFRNLSQDEQKEFVEIEKKALESLNNRIKYYEDYVQKVLTKIQALEAAEAASIAKIASLQKEKVKIDDTYKEAHRKNMQSTMTDEEKYADDVKNINELKNQALALSDKSYLEKRLSEIQSLPKEVKDSNNKIIVDEKEMQSLKKQLLTDNHNMMMKLTDEEIQKQKENVKSIEEQNAALKKSLEEAQLKMDEFKSMKVEIETTSFLNSIEVIKTAIADVFDRINRMKGEAPLDVNIDLVQPAIDKVKEMIDGLVEKISGIKNQPIEVSIAGKEGVPLQDYLTLQKESVNKFAEDLKKEVAPVVAVDFQGKGIEGKTDFVEVMTEVNRQLKTIPETTDAIKPTILTGFQINLGEKVESFTEGLMSYASKMEPLKAPTESTHKIIVEGLDLLEKAIKYHADLSTTNTHSYHTVHVTTVNDGGGGGEGGGEGSRTGGYIAARLGGFIQRLRSGGAFTGALPGYGGGDIVNARLEPGEFVLRKEAVKQIGVNALRQWNNLNSAAMKSINPQSGSKRDDSMFTGQLHTINLNIGGESHQVFAQPNVLNSLTSSLRRARLMRV